MQFAHAYALKVQNHMFNSFVCGTQHHTYIASGHLSRLLCYMQAKYTHIVQFTRKWFLGRFHFIASKTQYVCAALFQILKNISGLTAKLLIVVFLLADFMCPFEYLKCLHSANENV